MSHKTVVVIPARLASQRLPNKVLLDLKGKPVVQRVYERAKQAANINDVYIATDSEEVKQVCHQFTENIVMTRPDHPSGTDRIAEAVAALDVQAVINVQGDEPFIDPKVIEQLADKLSDPEVKMATVVCPIVETSDLLDPNVVKAVINDQGRAMYFSRSPIPFPRDINLASQTLLPEGLISYRHLGIYGYQKDFLLHYAGLKPTYLEKTEKLEQLRVLESGFNIHVIQTSQISLSIDSQEDLEKARTLAEKYF